MTRQSLKNISRIESGKSQKRPTWEVRIVRAGNSFHRSFADAAYGGKKAALAAAIRCRNAELKKRPVTSSYEQAIRPKASNKSGIVGVREGERVARRGRKVWRYSAWIVTGTPVSGGKTTTKYFIKSHFKSNKAAREAAIRQRRAWERSLKASIEAREKSPR
jgi:hypothetical protein